MTSESDAHDHPVDAERVAVARSQLIDAAEAARLAGLLGLLSDPTRTRILFALNAVAELCVGDLALVLGVSEDAIGYGLRMLRTARLVSFRKEGRVVFYRLADGFPHRLLEHCLLQLLSIADPGAMSEEVEP
ncbi:MAG TPA: metalloregulator ArsR/SmtB family transcription factor [Acidimicrobiales bacterium]|nr:metalloregulator ArsR/SmtB family transcription factor [Acidimicrobiales bacterium]